MTKKASLRKLKQLSKKMDVASRKARKATPVEYEALITEILLLGDEYLVELKKGDV